MLSTTDSPAAGQGATRACGSDDHATTTAAASTQPAARGTQPAGTTNQGAAAPAAAAPGPNAEDAAGAAAAATGVGGGGRDEEEPGRGSGSGTLGLPAPSLEGGNVQTLEVDGKPMVLDHLGPMVVHKDGTLSRIANWDEMTEIERRNTVRILVKRNQVRLSALRAGLPKEEETKPSS